MLEMEIWICRMEIAATTHYNLPNARKWHSRLRWRSTVWLMEGILCPSILWFLFFLSSHNQPERDKQWRYSRYFVLKGKLHQKLNTHLCHFHICPPVSSFWQARKATGVGSPYPPSFLEKISSPDPLLGWVHGPSLNTRSCAIHSAPQFKICSHAPGAYTIRSIWDFQGRPNIAIRENNYETSWIKTQANSPRRMKTTTD